MTCQEDHRQPLCSRSCPKRASREIFQYLVTPNSIPEFIIPSLDVLEEHRVLGKESGLAWSSPKGRTNCSLKDKCCSFCPVPLKMEAEVCDIPDPVVRAALSLPHLPKITTPYGFVALGESPHITKEEALFFQLGSASLGDLSPKGHLEPQGGHQCHGHKELDLATHPDANLKGLAHRSCLSHSSFRETRSQHEPNLDTETKDASLKSLGTLATEFPPQKSKGNLFQKILKKRFAHHWHLKMVRFPSH